MNSKEIRGWSSGGREMGTVLRDHYDLLLPALVARIKYHHPSILSSLENKGGLIDNMCREAGLFFDVEHDEGKCADRMSVYIDELACALATVIAPLLYFSTKVGMEQKLADHFATRFKECLDIRVGGYLYASQETNKKYGKRQTGKSN